MSRIPKGLNQKYAKQALKGKKWGPKDQARYDKLVNAKKKATAHQEKPKPQPKPQPKPEPQPKPQPQPKPAEQEKGEVRLTVEPGEGRSYTGNPAQDFGGSGQSPKKEDGMSYAGGTPGFYDKGGPGNSGNPIDRSVTGDNDSVPSNKTVIENTQTQDVKQDNDINTNIDGNNNTVINEQDNSIRQYGGDNRSFVYNGGGKGGTGTPVSAATMSGFYDVDDSPAAQAKFNDMYTTMNRDNQKRYAGDAMKTFAKYGNLDARNYTDESMTNTINRGIQYSFDRSDRQTGHVFGDIWNNNYITEEWKMPSAPAPIESNAEKIAKDAKDDIEDL